jgi:very-short-patch-repair endonuclease
MSRFDRTEEKTSRARELRKGRSNAEALAWSMLRGNCTGFHFRRQHPIGPYVADFYCAALRLVIEMDGDQHARQVAHDARRTEFLSTKGLMVLRFWNRSMFEDIRGFEQTLHYRINERARELGVKADIGRR